MIDNKYLSERITQPHQDLGRDPYLRDKARILHSAFFRRLQSKKQILDPYLDDFSRTRLTHTLEVAQISVGICEILKNQKENSKINCFFPSTFCIEAIALAHDLGHPPNGHGGESALNYLMRNDGGFEGNAQTFRIISKLGEGEISQGEEDKFGLNLTRATMLGTLKYPKLYSSFKKNIVDVKKNGHLPKFSEFKPPKCIFDQEKENLDWVLKPFKTDIQKFIDAGTDSKKSMNFFASIMDVADDISYGVHDLEDALTLDLLSAVDIQEEMLEFQKNLSKEYKNIFQKNFGNINKDLDCYSEKQRKRVISKIVNFFISNCKINKKRYFDDPILDYNVFLPKPWDDLLEKFKKIIDVKVIKSRENRILDFKLQNIIVKVFKCFQNDINLLPSKYQSKIKQEKKQENRIICDYIAGMTDKHLVKIYKALFFPEVGSIFDRL